MKSFAKIGMVVAVVASGMGIAACSSGNGNAKASKTITVGAIGTLTGTLAANFKDLVPGVEAYFKTIDANGGVDGYKFNFSTKLNLTTGGNPTVFKQDAQKLVNQYHVFAVVGVATPFFSSSFFVTHKTPVFGYNVTGGWATHPNLFANGGSYLFYTTLGPITAYIAKKAHATKVGVVSYGITASSTPCKDAVTGLKKAGDTVAFTNTNVAYFGTTVGSTVQTMKADGVNLILSCMTGTANIKMAKDIKEFGMTTKQLWLNGDTIPVVQQYASVMQGVYFSTTHVPFTAPTKLYPGLGRYLAAMKKYEPKYEFDDTAIDGWQSAALFVTGVKHAGKTVTQASVITAINHLTTFTATGLAAPVNWENAHTSAKGPFCSAFEKVTGSTLKPVYLKKKQVYTCFGTSLSDKPVKGKPGTPGL